MKIRFFTIPIFDLEEAEKELNRFLSSHRVLNIEKHFVNDGYWAIAVQYIDGEPKEKTGEKKSRIDYKEILSENEFILYAKLRTLRKDISDREGVPPYALFTNEQLAKMVQDNIRTKAMLGQIQGVGEARLKKYGDEFLRIMNEKSNEEEIPDAETDQN